MLKSNNIKEDEKLKSSVIKVDVMSVVEENEIEKFIDESYVNELEESTFFPIYRNMKIKKISQFYNQEQLNDASTPEM